MTEPAGHKPLVVNGVVAGPFEEEEEGIVIDLTCKRGSFGQSEGLLIPSSSFQFRLKPENRDSNSHEFKLHRTSIKGTKLLLKVTKANIIISQQRCKVRIQTPHVI